MAGQFAGKAAVVTGAGSGIGRASALAGEGARVVVADVAPEGGEEVEDTEPQFAAYQPMGRMATVEGVAAVVWLCSDAASFITGHALPIDGGTRAR